MARAMEYPQVVRILLEGGYVASKYYHWKQAQHTVHSSDGTMQGHLTGSQMEELLAAGVIDYRNESKPEKGVMKIEFFRLRRKHGHWIDDSGEGDAAVCSCCGECYDTVADYDYRKGFELFCECYQYCPSCGAKMGGEENG